MSIAYNIFYFCCFAVLCCCFCSVAQSSLTVTPCSLARQAPYPFTISWSWLRLMSIQSVMPSNNLILRCLLLFFPSIFPNIRVFTSESDLPNTWPKVWSFNFSIRYSHEYSALIPFRNDWFGPFSVQGTLKSLLQHCN